MLMFKGEKRDTTTTLTESAFYESLEEGNIYGKFIYKEIVTIN